MNINNYKLKIQKLMKKSKEKELIKTYDEFLQSEEANEYALTKEVSKYM